jgi:xylitol oxidase
VEEALAQFGARPHWGKLCSPRAWGAAAAAYGEGAQRFAALRQQLDPTGKFLNAALVALLQVKE